MESKSILLNRLKENIIQYLKHKRWLMGTSGKTFIRTLDDILLKTKTYEDFINECKKQGIYVKRKLDYINHNIYFVYSIPKNRLDIEDSYLPPRFRHHNIEKKFNTKYREVALSMNY